MRAGIVVQVTRADRRRLEAIVADRGAPQKHVIGVPISSSPRRMAAVPPRSCGVGQGQAGGVDLAGAALADAARLCATRRASPASRRWRAKPFSGWSIWRWGRRRARPRTGAAKNSPQAVGVSLRSVQHILEAHQLAPHRMRSVQAVEGPGICREAPVVCRSSGSCRRPLGPMRRAKSRRSTRTQPQGLPMKGRAGTMTHDYKRHGTTTLFAALNVLDSTVIGHNMQRHRHQEFIRFLRAQVPARNAMAASRQTTPPTNIQGAIGSPDIRAGHSTSHPPRRHGSTPSKASLPSEQGAASSAAFPTCRPLSTASSQRQTPIRERFVWTANPKRIFAAVKRGKETLK